MKQSKLSILFPRQDEVTYREIPEESWHDLGLDTLTEKLVAQPQVVPAFLRNLPVGPFLLAGIQDTQF